jgi:hypothetical protein
MAYIIHFTSQASTTNGTTDVGTPWELKEFSLTDGRFIELATRTTKLQGLGTLSQTPITSSPNRYMLPGRSAVNWGEVINENILHLIEQSASEEVSSIATPTFTAVPISLVDDTAIRGQSWYNLADDHVYVFDGTVWNRQASSTDAVVSVVANATVADTLYNLAKNTTYTGDDFVEIAGDTMTGLLVLSGDPVTALGAATKQYVDQFVDGGGDTMTGFLTLSADPTNALHAATMQYVDAQLGAISFASEAANENYVVNGNLSIWQRGPGPFSAVPATDIYTADRWNLIAGTEQSGFAASVTRELHVSGDIPDAQPRYNIRYAVTVATGATTEPGGIRQLIENSRTLNGQEATLSVWARSDTSTPLNWSVDRNHGTGGIPATDAVDSGTFALTTSWVRYSATMTVLDMTGVTTDDADSFMSVFFNLGVNTTGNIQISNVQLEPGNVARKFRMEPQAEILNKCERYYNKTYNEAIVPGTTGSPGALYDISDDTLTGAVKMYYKFPTKMRAIPTIITYSPTNGTSGMMYRASGPAADVTTSTETVSDSGVNIINSATAVALQRHRVHIVADAEL